MIDIWERKRLRAWRALCDTPKIKQHYSVWYLDDSNLRRDLCKSVFSIRKIIKIEARVSTTACAECQHLLCDIETSPAFKGTIIREWELL